MLVPFADEDRNYPSRDSDLHGGAGTKSSYFDETKSGGMLWPIDHPKFDKHLQVVEELMKREGAKEKEVFYRLQQDEDARDHGLLVGPTNKLFRSVLSANQHNLAFLSHEALIHLQEVNGVYMDNNFHNRHAASR